jgi:hypothetical protein
MLAFDKAERISVSNVLLSNYITKYHSQIKKKDIRTFMRSKLTPDAPKKKEEERVAIEGDISAQIDNMTAGVATMQLQQTITSEFVMSLPAFMFFSWQTQVL